MGAGSINIWSFLAKRENVVEYGASSKKIEISVTFVNAFKKMEATREINAFARN